MQSQLETIAREILKGYDIPALTTTGISKSTEHFGTSHTVVTYFPLNTLGRISQEDVLWRLPSRSPLNLYIHIPFCRSKCLYCSYVSEPNPVRERVEEYLSALSAELGMYSAKVNDREVSSVYVGGGTPTVLEQRQLESLLAFIRNSFNVSQDAGLCVEANPVTLLGQEGEEKLRMLVSQGVTRMSIGVQSFSEALLRHVGRGYYSESEAIAAIKRAKEAGIKTVNVDMMQDLPDQNLEDVEDDLEIISELMPESVTWYNMRSSPDCRLRKITKFQYPSEEESLVARVMITERLKEIGYTQTSGDRFCLSDESKDRFKEMRSNVAADMLGVGVSAYSHLEYRMNALLFKNIPGIDEYVQQIRRGKLPIAAGREYDEEEYIIADVVLGLRNGFKLSEIGKEALFGKRWGYHLRLTPEDRLFDLLDRCGYRKKIPQLVSLGVLELNDNTLQFTPKGRLFENEICRMLYSPIVDAETKGQRWRAFWRWFWGDVHKHRPLPKA